MPLSLTPRGAMGAAPRLPAPLRRESGTVAIGRDAASDLVVEHPLASARHCQITGSGAAWQLQDTSTNGTFLNGERVMAPRPLRHGDVIRVADVEFQLSLDPASAADLWGRSSAPVPPVAASPVAAAGPGDAAGRAAVAALARLMQRRAKARADLKLPADDAGSPFAVGSADAAVARVQALPAPAAAEAVVRAGEALEAHDRAMLAAMQAAFRHALDQFAPAAIRQRAGSDAAAWRAYARAFDAADGFVETFAQELAKAYAGGTKT